MALDKNELNQFITNAQVQMTGASEAGIKLALYEVMKEFFNDSASWTEDITFVPRAAVDTYAMAPAEQGQLIRLVGVWDFQGTPVPAFMQKFGQLKLLHAPQTDGSADKPWTARFEKTVSQPVTADNVPLAPDWTLRVYSVHILDGLLGQMMLQPNKSYTDQTRAAYHLKRFRAGIAMARTQAKRLNGVGNQTWAFPQGTMAKGSQRGGVSTAWPTRF